jgi:hypothetical protein
MCPSWDKTFSDIGKRHRIWLYISPSHWFARSSPLCHWPLLLSHIRGVYEKVFWYWKNLSRDFDAFTRFEPPWYTKVVFGLPCVWFCIDVSLASVTTVKRILFIIVIQEFILSRLVPGEYGHSSSRNRDAWNTKRRISFHIIMLFMITYYRYANLQHVLRIKEIIQISDFKVKL